MKRNTSRKQFSLLICDSCSLSRRALFSLFESEDYSIHLAASFEECKKKLDSNIFNLLLIDFSNLDAESQSVINFLSKKDLNVMVFSTTENFDFLNDSFKHSNFLDFLDKENKAFRILMFNKVRKFYSQLFLDQVETTSLDSNQKPNSVIIGNSQSLLLAIEKADRIAKSKLPVVISAETGAGKELFAERIHLMSGRKGRLVTFNCASINQETMYSELFGHVKGAYTGSIDEKIGLIEAAHGGTLFIDEIGRMPKLMQSALLRVLENSEIIPMGSTKSKKIDLRVIAATNVSLNQLVDDNKFLEDLYFRISKAVVKIPALRDRIEDLEVLIQYYIQKVSTSEGIEMKTFTDDAIDLLRTLHYKGNIRELFSIVHTLIVLSKEQIITRKDILDYQNDHK